MSHEQINHDFNHHPPSAGRALLHSDVRGLVRDLMHELEDKLPDGREKAVVKTKLEEAMFWANAAIARSADGT